MVTNLAPAIVVLQVIEIFELLACEVRLGQSLTHIFYLYSIVFIIIIVNTLM